MHALVHAGALGNVFFGKADGQWYRPPSYYELWWRGTWAREGGGAATGQGIHILDQTLWILGKRPVQVIGKIGTFVHPVPRARAEGSVPIEDTALGSSPSRTAACWSFAPPSASSWSAARSRSPASTGRSRRTPGPSTRWTRRRMRGLARFVEQDVPPLPEAWRPKKPELDPYRNPGPNAAAAGLEHDPAGRRLPDRDPDRPGRADRRWRGPARAGGADGAVPLGDPGPARRICRWPLTTRSTTALRRALPPRGSWRRSVDGRVHVYHRVWLCHTGAHDGYDAFRRPSPGAGRADGGGRSGRGGRSADGCWRGAARRRPSAPACRAGTPPAPPRPGAPAGRW